MNRKKIGFIAGGVLAGAAVIYLIYRLIAALFGLVTGAVDLVIGLVVLIALAAIVIWMFAYARKKRR